MEKKEAMKILKDFHDKSALFSVRTALDTIIPELRESEDERIRKELIKGFKESGWTHFSDGLTIDDAIAWLEKQKEPELSEDLGEYITELSKQFPEVSFAKLSRIAVRVKNWLEKQGKETSWKPSKEEMDVLYGLAYITNQYDERKEEVITRLYQDLKREFFNGSSYENMFPTNISIEDDVRRRSTIQVLEYARSLDTYNQYGKADIDKNISWLEKQGKQNPYGQRKECLDCQFNYSGECKGSCAMKRSEQKPQRMVSAEAKEALYDKPTDEEMKELLRTEYEKGRADVIAEMKLSWSEEDEKMLEGIVNTVKDVRCQSLLSEIEIYDDYIDWLKSLKDRYTWRPSSEQIDTLEHFIRSIGESGYALPYDNNTKLLYSLLEQLKKLKA